MSVKTKESVAAEEATTAGDPYLSELGDGRQAEAVELSARLRGGGRTPTRAELLAAARVHPRWDAFLAYAQENEALVDAEADTARAMARNGQAAVRYGRGVPQVDCSYRDLHLLLVALEDPSLSAGLGFRTMADARIRGDRADVPLRIVRFTRPFQEPNQATELHLSTVSYKSCDPMTLAGENFVVRQVPIFPDREVGAAEIYLSPWPSRGAILAVAQREFLWDTFLRWAERNEGFVDACAASVREARSRRERASLGVCFEQLSRKGWEIPSEFEDVMLGCAYARMLRLLLASEDPELALDFWRPNPAIPWPFH